MPTKATAFAGSAEASSSLPASPSPNYNVRHDPRTPPMQQDRVGCGTCATWAPKPLGHYSRKPCSLKRLYCPGDHIVRKPAERIVEGSGGSRSLKLVKPLALLEQARCQNVPLSIDDPPR